MVRMSGRTFFFEVDTAFGYNYRHIAVNVALTLIVEQTYGDVRVSYTVLKRYAKDAGGDPCTRANGQ